MTLELRSWESGIGPKKYLTGKEMALAVSFFKYQKRDLEENPTLILGQKYLERIYTVCELLLKINKLDSAIA